MRAASWLRAGRPLSARVRETSHAHDGTYGISNPGWAYRTDVVAGPGITMTAWARPSSSTSGRFYFGFDATSSGCKSFVMAPNTTELLFQRNTSYGYSDVADVSQSFTSKWYRVEVVVTGSIATGRLYDSDGVTLINELTHDFGSMGTGGMAMRGYSFGYIDTLVLCP